MELTPILAGTCRRRTMQPSVTIQTSPELVPAVPSCFGEVVLIAAHLCKHDILTKISERVRFARPRIARYEVIDFLAVLIGYAIVGNARWRRSTRPSCRLPALLWHSLVAISCLRV